MVEEITELFAYNRWANRRTLEAAAQLSVTDLNRDLKSSFPSVLATLIHMLSVEWVWLQRWHGRSPGARPTEWDLTTLDALGEHWAQVEREQGEFLRGLQPEALAVEFHYRNVAGKDFAEPLGLLLRHVVNHSTYHRGQVTTMLRQMEAKTVGTDLVLFYREGGMTAPAP